MPAADAVAEEMRKAFGESDATAQTEGEDAQGIPDAQPDSPALENAAAASSASASGVALPNSVGAWLCTKCKLQKKNGNAVQLAPIFACKPCITKRNTLSQMLGPWPVDLFVALTAEQQTEFWRSQGKGKVQIQNALVKKETDARVEATRNRLSGVCLASLGLRKPGLRHCFNQKKMQRRGGAPSSRQDLQSRPEVGDHR